MTPIARHARLLEIASLIFAIAMISITCAKWLFGWLPEYSTDTARFLLRYETDALSLCNAISVMPPLHRALGLLIDSIAVAIACTGIWQFVGLCRQIRTGEFFSSITLKQLHTLSLLALAWALYHPIRSMLLSLITSLHKHPHILALSVSTDDVIHVAIFSCFALIAAVIKEGSKIKQEHDLTV